MRPGTPPRVILESSQRRSAALLFHCRGAQCAAGNCLSTAFSDAPSATSLASYAAWAAHAYRRISPKNARIGVIFASFSELASPEARLFVVVHHADRLHERVHRGRPDETETALPEVLGERLGASPGKAPDVLGEAAEFLSHFEDPARILDGGIDLAGMPHDARIGEQPAPIARTVGGDLFHLEPPQRPPVVLALGEDGGPGEPRLRALEREAFEKLAVFEHRDAPLLVVVGDRERVLGPGATLLAACGAHAVVTLRAKPPKRSSTRSRQAESGSSGASSSRGLITRAHWKIEKST